MASIEKRPTGWRVKVRMRGVAKSATFATKSQAQAWAGEVEHRIRRGEPVPGGALVVSVGAA
jgi:hypothetical protein